MNRIITAISLLLASALLGGTASAALLVENGQPRAEIVIAEEPARMARLAASELQTYIEKISGARLPVVTEPSGEAARIYVGISSHSGALGLDTEGLKYGAFRMASGPDWLALLGPDKDFEPVEPWGRSRQRPERRRINAAWDEITGDTFANPFHSLYMHYNEDLDIWSFDDRGTLHAVYAFLHDLGVRWYFPGELGEVVPSSMPDIALPVVDRTIRPDFAVRSLGWWYQFVGESEEDARWRLRLGQHLGHDVMGITQSVHGMKYVHGRDEFQAAHPEFFALWNGERATGHKSGQGAPCLSSEGLFEKHVAYARAVFDHFGEPMISLDVVDGYSRGPCACEACRGSATPDRGARGRMSDYVWEYINRVATALYESHPDRMVSGLAYGAYRLPPENIERMSPNLALILMPSRAGMDDPQSLREDEAFRRAWLEKLPSGQLMTFTNFIHNRPAGATAGIPVFFPRASAAYLRAVKGEVAGERFGVYEHFKPEEHDWDALAVPHLDLVVISRLWWDADLDVDVLLAEYVEKFYGPAADAMRAFIEYCEAHHARMLREAEPITQALLLLQTAKEQVDSHSVYGRRIQRIADYVRPLHDLRAQHGRARTDVPRARLLPHRPLAGKQLDGRLDDDRYWPVMRTLRLDDVVTGRPVPPDRRTWVRIFWADNAVYFGIRCAEPDMAGLKMPGAGDDAADIRQGDFVEILFETLTHSHYRITISPCGKMVDSDRSEGGVGDEWNSNAEWAVHRGDDYWSVEVRIPLEGEGARDLDPRIGVDGRAPTELYTWFFNVGRQRVRDGRVERVAFAPTGSADMEAPERFAELWGKTLR